jgi:acetyltransferase-like isoleucine patch superfamily enzyme
MADFISKLGRKILAGIGLTDSQMQMCQILYDRYKMYGVVFFPKDGRRHLEVLRKAIQKKNKKYRSYRFVKIGDFTHMRNARIIAGFYDTHLIIGKFCAIAEGVSYMMGGEHRTEWISANGYGTLQGFHDLSPTPPEESVVKTKGDIVIGNDVWIAGDAKLLSGVTIGDGAVIGANSLVAKDVPSYAIYAGNPARLVRMRFSDDEIKTLEEIKWWDWPLEHISAIMPVLNSSDIPALKRYYDEHIRPR